MNKKETIKLSKDVDIELIYSVDGKKIVTINVFKDKGSVASVYLGNLKRKDK